MRGNARPETTLFDRFEKAHGAKIVKMLTVQYRMNEKIMAWASAAMYKNKLLSDPSVRPRPIPATLLASTDIPTAPIANNRSATAGCHSCHKSRPASSPTRRFS